jgi:5-formyltetrahydrofolate cyclo-ligase
MEREKVRRRIIAARDRLPPEHLALYSELVIEKLFGLAEFRAATTVLFYASFNSEVQTRAALGRCLETGKRVALPLTLPKERVLRPYLIKDPRRDLKPGYRAIPEPDPEAAVLLDPHDIEIVIVPGAVFDHNGGRLGYGGGFYDRFLADQAPAAFRVALAFALQVIAQNLPLAPHDQPLDCLITEKKIFRFARTPA